MGSQGETPGSEKKREVESMKKKHLIKTAFLCLLTASVMLSGCGKPDEEAAPKEETENIDEKEDDKSGEEEAEVLEYPEKEYETLLLTRNNYSNEITIYETGLGSSVTYNRKDLFEKFTESEKEFYRLYDKDNYDTSSLECAGGDFLFFSDSVQMGSDEEYGYIVYAVNVNDSKVYDIWTGTSDNYVQACEYYDDKLYIDYYLGTVDGKSTGYNEICFKYDEKSDTFEESRLKIADIIDNATSNEIRLRGSSSGPNYKSTSFTRSYDECGFILGNNEDGYVTVDRKGNVTTLNTPDNIYVYAYNENSLIYMQYDDSYVHGQVCIFDLESEKGYPVSDEFTSATFLGQKDNSFYYAIDKTEEYGLTHYYVYRYDSNEDESTLLYDEEYVPGTGLQPGIEGFAIGDTSVCYIKAEDGILKWVVCFTDIPSAANEICELSAIDLFSYGKVDYVSNTAVCDKCGTPLEKNYYEYFILDDSVSEYADNINETLYDSAVLSAATGDVIEDVGDAECAEHKEHPDWYLMTDSVNVSDVEIFSDKYLAVNTSGYWYGGGAHGYPSRNQYLFDLTTGEILTIGDFYEGNDKDFKELIAEKTKEDFLSYDYYSSPYFAQDEETVYNDAYEYAGLESGCVEFTEDGIVYYYPPYNMGPYASGFIEIFVSYEELLGRDSL